MSPMTREPVESPIHSLQARLTKLLYRGEAILVLVIIILIISSGAFVYSAVENIQVSVSKLHLEVARRALASISDSMEERLEAERRLARQIGENPQDVDHTLTIFLRDNPEFQQVSYLDALGKEAARVDRYSVITKGDLGDFATSQGFLEAIQKKEFGDSVTFSSRGEPTLMYFVPVVSLQGDFLGAVRGELDLRFMWTLVSEIKPGSSGKTYVVDSQGRLIADPDSSLVLQGQNFLAREPITKILSQQLPLVDGLENTDHYVNSAGTRVFSTAVLYNQFDWAVVTEEPLDEAYFAADRTLTVGATLSGMLLLLLIILFLAMRQLIRANTYLENERRHTSALVSNLTDGVIEYSTDLVILLLNPQAESLLNVKAEEVVGKSLKADDVSTEPRFDLLRKVFEEELSGMSHRLPTTHDVVLSPQHVVQVSSVLVSFTERKVETYAKILHDVTRERFLERMKSEFISIVAHQLRTPLSGVKWILGSVVDGDFGKLTVDQLDFIKKAYDSNERMIALVANLLDASRIEEGRFGYRFQDEDFIEFFQQVLKDFDSRLAEKNISLVFAKPGRNYLLFFDPEKLELALSNIVANAINYTAPGGTVSINFDERPPYLEIRVKDSGVGIPSYQLNRIFTKFFRADNVVRMQTSGSGLGLFLARSIVEAHGGKVWIESQENIGTTVFLTLPLVKNLVPVEEKVPLALFSESKQTR